MKAFRYLLLGLVALGLGYFAVQSSRPSAAQTVTDVTDCRSISASGSYRLASDIDTTNADCITIRGNYSNITFDGNGKSITSPNRVFDIADLGGGTPSNITITNFTSTGDIRLFGDAVHHVTIQNSNIRGVVVYGSDDVTIQNNTIGAGGLSINNSDSAGVFPLRAVVTGNTITGGSTDLKILVELVGGSNHPCPRTDAVFTGNTITDTRADTPTEANAAVRIRCATHNTFSNNTVHSTATTIGLYIRDESDYGTYENNTFWSHDEEAFRMASGNLDKTLPANNVFRNNVFRSDNVATLFFQGQGLYNTFQNNIFWGASGGLTGLSGGLGSVWDHNTFYVTNSGTLTTLTYRTGPPPEHFTNNIFDYSGSSLFGYDGWVMNPYSGDRNLFYNRAGAVSFGGRGASLSAWRTSNSSDANSIEANPLFVDPANGDFHLQSGSPARGIGTGGGGVMSGQCRFRYRGVPSIGPARIGKRVRVISNHEPVPIRTLAAQPPINRISFKVATLRFLSRR